MIYQGVADSPTPDAGNMTGEGTQIGTGQFNSSDDNNMYVKVDNYMDYKHLAP